MPALRRWLLTNKKGGYADRIPADGNPLESPDLVADPEKNFVIIMKDSKIYKHAITSNASNIFGSTTGEYLQ